MKNSRTTGLAVLIATCIIFGGFSSAKAAIIGQPLHDVLTDDEDAIWFQYIGQLAVDMSVASFRMAYKTSAAGNQVYGFTIWDCPTAPDKTKTAAYLSTTYIDTCNVYRAETAAGVDQTILSISNLPAPFIADFTGWYRKASPAYAHTIDYYQKSIRLSAGRHIVLSYSGPAKLAGAQGGIYASGSFDGLGNQRICFGSSISCLHLNEAYWYLGSTVLDFGPFTPQSPSGVGSGFGYIYQALLPGYTASSGWATPADAVTGFDLSGAQSYCAVTFPAASDSFGIAKGLCTVAGFLVIPSVPAVAQYSDLTTQVRTVLPFSYFSDIAGLYASISYASASFPGFTYTAKIGDQASISFDLFSWATITHYLPPGTFGLFYNLMIAAEWFGFGWWVFHRVQGLFAHAHHAA